MKKNKISDVLLEMEQGAFTVTPDTTVLEAVPIMADNHGAAVVLDDDRLAGIITERDCLNRVIAAGLPPAETPVKDVMTGKVTTISPGETVMTCLNILMENEFRHMPVLDGNKAVGLVCVCDLVKRIIAHQREMIKDMTDYIELSY